MNCAIPSISCGRAVRLVALLAAISWISGCFEKPYEAPKLDAVKARETLTKVLDLWKNGKTRDSLITQDPPVIVQDIDWSSGAKLVKYELDGEPTEADGTLRAKVKLSLQVKGAGAKEATVTYIVGTSPGLTVLRDINP